MQGGGRAQCAALLPAQDPIGDFANDLRPQNPRFGRVRKTLQQAHRSFAEFDVQLGGIDSLGHGRRGGNVRAIHFHQQLAEHRQIHADGYRQHGPLRTRLGFAFKRQRHRQHQVVMRVVGENPIPEIAALAALAHDHDSRFVQHLHAPNRLARAHQLHAIDRRGMDAFPGGQRAEQRRHPMVGGLQFRSRH